MKILKGYRGCGKTTYAIKEAFKTGAILVTGSVHMKEFIEHISREEMNMPIKVLSVRELMDRKNRTIYRGEKEKIIIDQLEWVLYEMFKNYEWYYVKKIYKLNRNFFKFSFN